ncbi:MAG: hypothetical protein CL908_26875 [Deltaproteobacteria bacterium]|nr:hypothetical protein [Deltaproteobacteria bacterium]
MSRATLAILAFGVIWGAAYLWMKDALLTSERTLPAGTAVLGVGLFMTARFGMAALVLGAACAEARSLRGAWVGGAVLGGLLFGGFLVQLLGLRGIDPAVSAFLTSLYVVFTVLIARGRRGVLRSPGLLAGIVLATAGAAWIGGPPRLVFGLSEWLTVFAAVLFAVHIVATDVVTKRTSPLPVTMTSLVWVTGASAGVTGIALACDPGAAAAIPGLVTDPGWTVPVLLSAILATSLALTLMNRYQRELTPVRAAILYAFEPVWAAVFAVGFGRADATGWLWFGGSCLVVGNLIAGFARPEVVDS